MFMQLTWGSHQNADFDLALLEWGQRFSISSKFLGYADVPGILTTT